MKQSIKLIIIIFILCLCGSYPVKADETYQSTTDYVISVPSTSENKVCNMPPITFHPDIIYNHYVHTNFVCGNATYDFGEKISSENDGIYTSIYETKISGGNNAGQIVGYTQEFKFLSTTPDTWESKFYFESKRACSGDVTLYYYKNNEWVQVEKLNFNTYINYDKIVPDANISGWKYVVHCSLNSNFTFLRYDNMYSDGYTLNQFSWFVRSSQQQEEDTQKSIEENTRNTNTLLGTVKNAIDNVKNAIDNVVTGITNLPRLILDGLKELFIPEDFSSTLQDGLEDISDSLGVVGYPIQFINDTLNTIKNTSGESLTIHLPSFKYNGHVIFPSYYRANIFYFGNNLVFSNINLVTPFTQFFNLFGVDCSTVTISQLVKILMRFCTGIALIGAIVNYYNNIFGTNINSGEEDGDDN